MKKIIVIVGAFVITLSAQSQELSKELYSLSLEELLQLDVVSASKSEESLKEAPSIITTIPREEFLRYGANNVMEILERSTSVYITGSYFIPDNYISIRGDAASGFNRHVLILINGRPTRETLFGGVDFGVLKSIPISSINRIEIIRGPGSVLYGSNAYTGVINIITTGNKDTFSGMVSGGSFNQRLIDISNTSTRGDLTVTSGLKYFRNDGWTNEITTELNELIARDMVVNGIGANISAQYKNLSVTGFVTNTVQNNLGVIPAEDFPGATPLLNRDITSTRFMLDAGYNAAFSDKWKTDFNVTLNESLISYDAVNGDFEGQSSDALFEATNFIDISEKVNLTVGGTAYLMSAGGELADSTSQGISYDDQTWWSAYFQADYKPIDNLKLVVGAQWNAPEGVEAAIVPRFGAIYNFNSRWGVKALYGEAFRTPYIAERKANEPPILVGNDQLMPQTIGTYDFQVFYNTDNVWTSLTAFRSNMRDVIQLTSPPNQTYVNQGEIEFEGIEFEGKILIGSNLFVNGSYSYQQNVDNEGRENTTHMPQQMAKLGLSYQTGLVNLGLYNMFVDKISDVSTVNPATREVNDEVSSFNYMTFNLNLDLLGLIEDQRGVLFLNTYITNLLDEKIQIPEFTRRNINSIQGRAGRAINVGLNFKF